MKADNLSDEEIKTYLNIERIPSPCKAAKSHRSVAENRGNKDKEQFIPQKMDFIKIAQQAGGSKQVEKLLIENQKIKNEHMALGDECKHVKKKYKQCSKKLVQMEEDVMEMRLLRQKMEQQIVGLTNQNNSYTDTIKAVRTENADLRLEIEEVLRKQLDNLLGKIDK